MQDILGTAGRIVEFVYQLADFLFKAIVAYSQTATGAKEWADVVNSLLALGVIAPSDVQPPVSSQSPSQSEQGGAAQAASAENLPPMAALTQFDASNQTGQVIRRPPQRHSVDLKD